MNKAYKLQLIDDSSFNISLEKVKFNNLDIPKNLPNGVKLKMRTKDSYKILKLTNNEVKLEFTREKYFEPNGLFNIEIVLTVDYKLKPSKNEEKEKIIKEDIEKYKNSILLFPAATRASILVSALTDINLKNPLIDPPYPLFENNMH